MARFCKNDFFKWAQKIKSVFCFIPHTHEGCDGVAVHPLHSRKGFNPHTHEGCDLRIEATLRSDFVSIHTPTKGVTTNAAYIALKCLVSIHTPTKGVTV